MADNHKWRFVEKGKHCENNGRKATGAKAVWVSQPAAWDEGVKEMSSWLTPEEMEAKKERNKKLLYISIPLLAILLGAGITMLLNL